MVFVDVEEIINENEFDRLSAASKLQLLLSHCKIDFKVPDTLKALKEIADNSSQNTGPKIITKIRNTIIHPNKKNRELLESWANRYSVSAEALYAESLDLFEYYLTLIILSLIGYNGSFRNQLDRSLNGIFGCQVPWNVEDKEVG